MPDFKKITIHIKGSCIGNPGPGGWAALLKYHNHELLLKGNSKHSTNNRMEITALLNALQALKCPCDITLYTNNSLYVQGILSQHLNPHSNKDLWQSISKALTNHMIAASFSENQPHFPNLKKTASNQAFKGRL